jgi:hypothetical protein
MEAQQCVKFTGTNSSIGLIVLINQCSSRHLNMTRRKHRPEDDAKSKIAPEISRQKVSQFDQFASCLSPAW